MEKDSDLFCKTWEEFPLEKQDYSVDKFLEQYAKDLHLDQATSFLSIGPGEGTIERDVINHHMPHLKTFIAVEPNPELLDATKKNMSSLHDLTQDLQNKRIEDYAGPAHPLSVVLSSHSLYYQGENLEHEIIRYLRWLSQDGVLIIIIAFEGENSLFSDFRKALWFSTMIPGDYAIRDVFLKYQIKFEEHVMNSEANMSSEIGRNALFDLTLNRAATQRERTAMQEVFDRHVKPGTAIIDAKQTVFIVKKSDNRDFNDIQ